jgi:ankyrin repeat protein
MPRHLPRPHERLEISEPCSVEWDSMAGNERVRFCAHCRLHVHNLAEITPRQAMELILRDGEGHSALWHARDNDEPEAADLLLAYGAFDDPPSEPEETPNPPGE